MNDYRPFRFLISVFAFLAPFFLLGILFEGALWETRETWSLERVVRTQQFNPGTLFQRGILDQEFPGYKYRQIRAYNPEILTAGSSRVQKFRTEMFGEPAGKFVNGTKLIDQVEDYSGLVTLLRSNLPRVLIVGLDPWIFHERWGTGRFLTRENLEPEASWNWRAHLAALRSMRAREVKSLGRAWRQNESPHIGVNAILGGESYRPDGGLVSFHAAPKPGQPFVDSESPPIHVRIRQGSARFPKNAQFSKTKLLLCEKALRQLQADGVLVIVFLPPFATESLNLLETLPDQKNFWFQYRKEMAAMAERLRLPFVDATNPKAVGCDDRYMYDGFHAEETFHLYLLKRLLEDPRVAQALPRASSAIERALQNPKSDSFFPDYH